MLSRWNSEELNQIETITLSHYDANAEYFWEGTKDHDVTQNIEAFLSACIQGKPLDILDFGCGPGRDVKYFKTLGHFPTGLDGSEAFCQFARDYTNCPILQQTFLNLELPKEEFDGILLMPHFSIFLVRNYPEFLLNYMMLFDPMVFYFLPILVGMAKGDKANDTVITWNWRRASLI